MKTCPYICRIINTNSLNLIIMKTVLNIMVVYFFLICVMFFLDTTICGWMFVSLIPIFVVLLLIASLINLFTSSVSTPKVKKEHSQNQWWR